jgi:RND superfamily putative drug exporter
VDRAEAVARRRLAETADAPRLYVTGQAAIGRDLTRAGARSLEHTTLATVLLVIAILLAVYRAPLLALVPLATIAGSVFVALKVLSLCTLIPGFYLVNISQVFAVVMLYGAGTDYCLFLISRYREELARGLGVEEALTRSVGGVGGALAASAGTVICGLGLMAFAEFAKVRSGGPAIAVGLAVALAASLTLTPALLRLLGKAVFWPVGAPRPQITPHKECLWGRISRLVTARPKTIWLTAVLVLLPLVVVGLQVKASYRATGELAATSESVEGLAVIQKHFTAGEVGPVTVLLESSGDWNGPDGRAVLRHLSRGLVLLDAVAEVRSLTQPLGEPLDPPAPCPATNGLLGGFMRHMVQGVNERVACSAKEYYLADPPTAAGDAPRRVTRLDVVLKTDPFDPRSNDALDLIQTWLNVDLPRSAAAFGPVRAECYGVTIGARDLAEVTESDRFRIDGLVLAGVFLILLVLVRSPALAAYLLASVLFSYFATLGATTLAAWLWGGRAFGEVDWRVPFFLFIILVAVGEDYNILLITRSLQERKRHGADEGVRRALRHTGGAITSCGLIMAGTFATLMLGGLSTLVQIGFALAFGVLLDTFVVRPFLAPAFTVWLWRREEARAAARPTPLRRAG